MLSLSLFKFTFPAAFFLRRSSLQLNFFFLLLYSQEKLSQSKQKKNLKKIYKKEYQKKRISKKDTNGSIKRVKSSAYKRTNDELMAEINKVFNAAQSVQRSVLQRIAAARISF